MRILLIVEPQRVDWYSYLKRDETVKFELLWYEKAQDAQSVELPKSFFSHQYYWEDFATPKELLLKIRPDKIVFFEIIDQRQIALLISCNRLGIKTFYLEHGAAADKQTALIRSNRPQYFVKEKLGYLLGRFKAGAGRMIRSKLFYFAALPQLKRLSSVIQYAALPVSMLRHTPNKALRRHAFPERKPSRFLLFNRANFEQVRLYTNASEKEVMFCGIPMFDEFYRSVSREENHVLYIDHPYLEENLAGWTEVHHERIAKAIYQFAQRYQQKVFVKLHPRSNAELWKGYGFSKQFLEVIQFGNFTELMLSSKLILSFSSTLVSGFLCAKKNLVLLGWHPEPFIFGADFSKTGLCHLSFNPEDLELQFSTWLNNNNCESNPEGYRRFIAENNYPFDGLATTRIIKAIVDDAVH